MAELVKNKIFCSLCGQRADVYTTVHRSKPFVDGENYQKLCFTCFSVPIILKQTYNSKGLIKENIDVPYCCQNLNTARDVYNQGSSDTLKQAKKSVESVSLACQKCKTVKDLRKPKPDWNLE